MKKLLTLGLSLAMLCSLAACGSSDANTYDDTQTSEEFYQEDIMVEEPQEEAAAISISCVESANSLSDASFCIIGDAVSTLFDQADASWMYLEFYTASGEQTYFVEVTKDADSRVYTTLVAADGTVTEGDLALENTVLDLSFERCRFMLDDVTTVQVYLVIDNQQQEAIVLDIADVECVYAASSGDGDDSSSGAAQTFDTATYYTYDAYGQRIDDVLQITIDSDYIQVSLLDRYETDPIFIDDEDDRNDFYWNGDISLYGNLLIDAQTGEEVYFGLDLCNQYSYEITPTEAGKTMEAASDDVFYASYQIRQADADGWVEDIAAGMVFSDLSQSEGLAQNASEDLGYYIGQDGAPNLNVYDGGFEIEGYVSYSIPMYEYYLTTNNYSYFNAIDNEGNHVLIQIRHYVDRTEYIIYDSDFIEMYSWSGVEES